MSPVCYVPLVTQHVPLHCVSLCKNMARASRGANNMHPLSWGGGANGKDLIFVSVFATYFYLYYTARKSSLLLLLLWLFGIRPRGLLPWKFWSWFHYFLQSEQSQKMVQVHTTLSLKFNIRRSHMNDRIRLLSPKGWEKFISSGRLLATLAVRK